MREIEIRTVITLSEDADLDEEKVADLAEILADDLLFGVTISRWSSNVEVDGRLLRAVDGGIDF